MEAYQLITYIPTLAGLGFYVTLMVLSIIHFKRSGREPFKLLFVSFLLLAIKEAYYLGINGAYFWMFLNYALGMDPVATTLLTNLVVFLPTFTLWVIATILLLLAVLHFSRERGRETSS
nr:hypothetical protein [Candidatus Sigynarchaeum springense]